ncbi:glycoside hydrolase superfamily, partial [Thamnocephalis sphaerospora]
LVLYWGQNSYGATHRGDSANWERPLAYYCESGLVDTVILSFMHVFGRGSAAQMDFSNHCAPAQTMPGSKLLDCPSLRDDVRRCQQAGVKVQLGLGGAAGEYGFSSVQDAEAFAQQLWDMAFAGNSPIRPFGATSLDGINLDIEGGSSAGYTSFAQQLRPLIITAAPQCPYPDAYMNEVLLNAEIDAAYVQFYNNYCGVQAYETPNFNFGVWDEWARTRAKRRNAKVYLGVPASPTAANIGYVPPAKLRDIVLSVQQRYESFGGIMLWDTSQAFVN